MVHADELGLEADALRHALQILPLVFGVQDGLQQAPDGVAGQTNTDQCQED